MQHYITLGDGRRIGIAAYVRAWKQCKMFPAHTYIGKSGWGQTAGEALRDLRAGLDDRINRRIPGYGVGRKWSDDYEREMLHARVRLNQPRLVIDWLPADLRDRFADRLRTERA